MKRLNSLFFIFSISTQIVSCAKESPVDPVVAACMEMLEETNAKSTNKTNSFNLQDLLNKEQESQVSSQNSENIGQIKQALFAYKDSIWPLGSEIGVCWEDADPNSESALYAKEAVENTWNKLLWGVHIKSGEGLKFVGWQKCVEGEKGIHITAQDGNPAVFALGSSLDGMSAGMVLNLEYKVWYPVCKNILFGLKNCVAWPTIHEFGHALGFAHEQNRPDTPGTDCRKLRQGNNGDRILGPWDQYSVMNYCSPDWNSHGKLSALDMIGARFVYAPTVDKTFCQNLIDTIEEQEKVYKDPKISQDARNFFRNVFKDEYKF